METEAAHRRYSRLRPTAKGATPWRTTKTALGGYEAVGTADRHPKPKAVPHLSVDERAARGKAARAAAPRSRHGDWEPASDRRDPVELLEEQAASRVPELVPIRYGRMLVSPFTFFRGAAYPMAADLASEPRTGLDVQLCGDAHLSNFGALRRVRSAARVQHQRLRRDAAGPVRVGREAARGQLRGGRPGSRLRRQTATVDQPGRDAFVPGGDQGFRRRCATSTSGTPASTSTRSRRWRPSRRAGSS